MNLTAAKDALEACIFDTSNIGANFNDVCDALGLAQCHLVDMARPDPLFLLSKYSEDKVPDYIETGVHLRDPWAEHVANSPRKSAQWFLDGDVFSESMRKSNEYYNFCEKHGIAHHAFYSLDPSRVGFGFAAFRSGSIGDFTQEERIIFSKLSSTINRVAGFLTEHKMDFARGTIDSIGKIGVPAFLMTDRARIVSFNDAMENVFDDDFYIKQGFLVANTPDSQKSILYLQELAKRKFLPDIENDVVITRPGRFPLILSPQRVTHKGFEVLPGASLIVTVKGANTIYPGALKVVQDMFGFTNAEAEVAFLLSQGKSTDQIVSAKRVSRSTVRTQVNRILSKTGANSRVELVAILNRYLLPG